MQKSTASLTSAESASLQSEHAILLQAIFFVAWSCMVSRYFFLQRVKQQFDVVCTINSSLKNHAKLNAWKVYLKF